MRRWSAILSAGVLGLGFAGCGSASLGAGASGAAVGVGVGVGGGVGGGSSSASVGTEPGLGAVTSNQLHLEWQPELRGDRTRISGYVYNDWIMPARDIILLVESLDANGQVVGRTGARVDRVLTPGTRSYFDVPVSTPAARYRVTVANLRWSPGDGSR